MKILIAKAYAKVMFDGVLAVELKRRGHEVHVLLPHTGCSCALLEQQGIRVLVNPVIQMRYLRRTFFFQDIFHFLRLVRLLGREKYDIINLHLPAARFFGRLAARLSSTGRIVSVLHGLEVHHERWTNRFDHATVCVSQAVKDNFTAQAIPAARLEVIPNGIDLAGVDQIPREPLYLHRELGLDQHIRLIGMIAYFYQVRSSVDKGHGFFIDAAGELSKRYPDIRFVIVGADRLTRGREAFFKSYARQIGAADKIFFLGERKDIFPILDSFTVHVFPSLKEGFGLVLIEAMARGVISIASDLACVREIMTDQQEGLLFEPGQTSALIEKIACVLDAPDWAATLAGNARRRVEENFTQSRMADGYENLFLDLLKTGRKVRRSG